MKIVMVTPFGLRPKSTVRVRALQLAEALVGRGHRVTILVPPWDDPASAGQTFEQNGVLVRQLRLANVPQLTLRLVRETLAEQPDVVHAFKPKAYSGFAATVWWFLQRLRLTGGLRVGEGASGRGGETTTAVKSFIRFAPSPPRSFALSQKRVPLVMDSDDWEGWGGWNELAPYSWLQKRLFAWQERWGLRHADGVTVASRTLESLVLSMGVPPKSVLYLPNGAGTHWRMPKPDEVEALRQRLALGEAPVALLFTRFFEFDVTVLARRWAAVVDVLPAARLLVVGKGLMGEEKQFHAAMEALGTSESVIDVGWQSFEALPAYFALAQVALYPMKDTLLNRTKCPVKLADYLQVGLPVVGEGVGQVREYLAGNTGGILVPAGDDDAFVAAILRLFRYREEAKRMGEAGKKRLATHFDWAVQAERVERFYEQRTPARKSNTASNDNGLPSPPCPPLPTLGEGGESPSDPPSDNCYEGVRG